MRRAYLLSVLAALLTLALCCWTVMFVLPTAAAESPPAAPGVTWQLDGTLQVSWSDGTLHEALCHRPGCAAPLVCRVSPCTPAGIGPGDVLIVIGRSGESAGVLVPEAPAWGYLPLVVR